MKRRRRNAHWKHGTPPPTPEGMVYARRPGGWLELVPESELRNFVKKEMDAFDELPEAARAALRESLTEKSARDVKVQEKAAQNVKTQHLGFGRAF